MGQGYYARTNKALNVNCEFCKARVGIPCWSDSGIGTHQCRIDKSKAARERRVDLFKDNYASRLLRFALEHGTTTLVALKKEQHRLGGSQGNIMHTLDTYFRGSNATSAVLQRGGRVGRSIRVAWIGSKGDTFEERASNWLATLTNAQLEDAHGRVEIDFVDAGDAGDKLRATGDWHGGTLDEMRALSWLKIVKYEIAMRSTRLRIAA